MDITRDVLKVNDYSMVRSQNNVTSYFLCRGEKSNIYIRDGDRNQKNQKKLISWDDKQKRIISGINFGFNS